MESSSFYKIRLDTPLVVASAQKLRFGLDKKVLTINRPTAAEQALLIALKKGLKLIDLQALAAINGMSKENLSSFLKKIQPVLLVSEVNKPVVKPLLCVVGDFKTERLIASNLSKCSWRVVVGAPKKNVSNQIIISADRYFPNILGHHRSLREGLSVLPIIFSDQSVLVGPVITSAQEHDLLADTFTKPCSDRFKYWASQINEVPSATETGANLLTVSGMIIDQIHDLTRSGLTVKRTLALKKSASGAKIKSIPFGQTESDTQPLAS